MKKLLSLFVLSAALFTTTAEAQTGKKPAPKKVTTVKKVTTAKKVVTKMPVDHSMKVRIITDSGTMIVKLYDSTPLHRDNFVKLVQEHFYDSLLFHRVIREFMIQGGDPTSKNAPAGTMLGNGGDNMARIPAEFRPSLFHKRGVLAAARDGNPEKASSPCQFYIVQGKKYSDADLSMMEQRMGRKFSPEQRKAYMEAGGTPFLDQNYTVFGEVISGLDVIDKIASVPKDQADRPIGDVHMRMEMVK